MGLGCSCVVALLDMVTVHTPFQILALLLEVVQSPATIVLEIVERWLGIQTTTALVLGNEILGGSVIFGAIAFGAMRVRTKNLGQPPLPIRKTL